MPGALLDEAARLLFEHSLFNGHPRFFGYITSSPAPIGALGDLLAAAVNPERRRVDAGADGDGDRGADRALDCRADRLSGRRRRAAGQRRQHGELRLLPCRARREGRRGTCATGRHSRRSRALRVYASAETHTWIQKAADLFGLGTDAIRWIPADDDQRMDVAALRRQIDRRPRARRRAVPRRRHRRHRSAPARSIRCAEIAAICRRARPLVSRRRRVRRARGACARRAGRPARALRDADSVAVDPHKWLYAPLEAGCALVRRPERSAARVLVSSAVLPLRSTR